MVWQIVVVFFLSGHQIELVGTQEFSSLVACNTQVARFAEIGAKAPWAVTCISQVKA